MFTQIDGIKTIIFQVVNIAEITKTNWYAQNYRFTKNYHKIIHVRLNLHDPENYPKIHHIERKLSSYLATLVQCIISFSDVTIRATFRNSMLSKRQALPFKYSNWQNANVVYCSNRTRGVRFEPEHTLIDSMHSTIETVRDYP